MSALAIHVTESDFNHEAAYAILKGSGTYLLQNAGPDTIELDHQAASGQKKPELVAGAGIYVTVNGEDLRVRRTGKVGSAACLLVQLVADR